MLDSRGLFGTITTATLLAITISSTAGAAIIAVQPDVVLSSPADVTLGATESDVEIKAFDERQCFVVQQALMTDSGWIPAADNNIVSCHLLHMDPVTGGVVLRGKAAFDGDIIGVISSSLLLDASDLPCGNGVIYPVPGTEPNRGLEGFQPNDRYQVHPNRRRIRVEVDVPSFSDQIRVITCCGHACDPVAF